MVLPHSQKFEHSTVRSVVHPQGAGGADALGRAAELDELDVVELTMLEDVFDTDEEVGRIELELDVVLGMAELEDDEEGGHTLGTVGQIPADSQIGVHVVTLNA